MLVFSKRSIETSIIIVHGLNFLATILIFPVLIITASIMNENIILYYLIVWIVIFLFDVIFSISMSIKYDISLNDLSDEAWSSKESSSKK